MILLIITRKNPGDWPRVYQMRRARGTSKSTLDAQKLKDYFKANAYRRIGVASEEDLSDELLGLWQEDDTASDGDDAPYLEEYGWKWIPVGEKGDHS